jgi:hypothetical protein
MDKKQVKSVADIEAKKMVKGPKSRMHKMAKGGKTNAGMLKDGRNREKLVNQFGNVKIGAGGR